MIRSSFVLPLRQTASCVSRRRIALPLEARATVKMGCCLSFLKGSSVQGSSPSETEMQQQQRKGGSGGRKSLSISRAMSAPSVEVEEDGATISGFGLALVGVTIEQDAAYWEVHIEIPSDGPAQDVRFGVATRKDQRFYKELEDQGEDSPEAQGTSLMRTIKVANGDVVGIAVQHSDLPMVQLSLNGEPLHDDAINRFRGTVYPAVFLPENDGISLKLVFNESDFKKESPHARFGPVIIARGII